MYEVIYEYVHKPVLVAPFSIISYAVSFIRLILRPIIKKYNKNIKKGEKSVCKQMLYYLSKDWISGTGNKMKNI